MEDQAKRNDDKVRAGKDAAALAVPPEEPGVAPTGKEDARRERVIEAAWRILGDRGGRATQPRIARALPSLQRGRVAVLARALRVRHADGNARGACGDGRRPGRVGGGIGALAE